MPTTRTRRITKPGFHVVSSPGIQKWTVRPVARKETTSLPPNTNQDSILDAARARMRALALEQAVATKALFDQWREKEATDDPEELKRRDQEMLELQLAMNANRREAGERIPFPELEETTEREDAA